MRTHGIGSVPQTATQIRRSITLAGLETVLSDAEVEMICRHLGHTWRTRKLPPGTTVRSMVYRGLHPDKSITAVLAELAAATPDLTADPPADSSWCEARDRLPEALWPALLASTFHRLRRVVGQRHHYRGHPVYIFDGSTLSMPDQPALAEAFARAKTKDGLSRFPVARLSVLVLASVEAVCDYRLGPYSDSEDAHLHQLWHHLPKGAICLWDRNLCSFYNLAKTSARGAYVLSRLHNQRRPDALIKAGRAIGRDEWLVPLTLAPHLRRQYNDPFLPDLLVVRLIRFRFRRGRKHCTLWLVTTLLDRHRYPRQSLVELFRKRWGIETRIGSLKTILQLAVLRSKRPDTVGSEVAATVLGHNLLWLLIHQAAELTGTPADRISFAGAIKTVLAFSPCLREATPATRPILYRRMLQHIARHTNPHRPGRVEPRLIKRNRHRYKFLKIPRDEARQKCLS